MRKDKKGKFHTLEEDILETWKKHGLIVTKETVKGNVWTITAKRKRKKRKPIEEEEDEEEEDNVIFNPPIHIPSGVGFGGGGGFGGGSSGGGGASGSW